MTLMRISHTRKIHILTNLTLILRIFALNGERTKPRNVYKKEKQIVRKAKRIERRASPRLEQAKQQHKKYINQKI